MEVVLPSIRNLFPDLFPAARAQDTPALPTRTSTPPAHVEDASDPHSTQNRQAAPLPLNGKGRRYTCAVCPKAFARPSSLAVHMRVHTGAKPYECPHQACGRSYQTKSNLVRHGRAKHGEFVAMGSAGAGPSTASFTTHMQAGPSQANLVKKLSYRARRAAVVAVPAHELQDAQRFDSQVERAARLTNGRVSP